MWQIEQSSWICYILQLILFYAQSQILPSFEIQDILTLAPLAPNPNWSPFANPLRI